MLVNRTASENLPGYVKSILANPRRPSRKAALFPTSDSKMIELQDVIWHLADDPVPVLFIGEVGVGKKFLAMALHRCSTQNGPVSVVRGACVRDFAAYDELFGGSLIIDEISELSAPMQQELLRIIQLKDSSFRIIATSRCDLAKAVRKGKFDINLYYRIAGVSLEVPPLRDRPGDIFTISEQVLQAKKYMTPRRFTLDALERLEDHDWPGNVSELIKVLKHSIWKAKKGAIEPEHLGLISIDDNDDDAKPHESLEWVRALPIGKKMSEVEDHMIIATLAECSGNRTHAALVLGMNLRTLRNKINKLTLMGYAVPQYQRGAGLSFDIIRHKRNKASLGDTDGVLGAD